jgi:hypothetical protein
MGTRWRVFAEPLAWRGQVVEGQGIDRCWPLAWLGIVDACHIEESFGINRVGFDQNIPTAWGVLRFHQQSRSITRPSLGECWQVLVVNNQQDPDDRTPLARPQQSSENQVFARRFALTVAALRSVPVQVVASELERSPAFTRNRSFSCRSRSISCAWRSPASRDYASRRDENHQVRLQRHSELDEASVEAVMILYRTTITSVKRNIGF